jgi:hypothetical protein
LCDTRARSDIDQSLKNAKKPNSANQRTYFGVLAYWRIGVLAYWRIGVLASLREPLAKNNRLSEVDQAIDQKSRKFFSRIRIF